MLPSHLRGPHIILIYDTNEGPIDSKCKLRTSHPFKELHKEYSSDTSTGPSSVYIEFTLSNTVTFYQYL
jgi:hypothetical protein